MTDFAPSDIESVLRDPQMVRVADKLRALIRPSIRLHMRLAEEGEDLPLGGTRFGGSPDLPPGTPWPTGHLEIPLPTEAFRAANVHHRLPPENGTFSLPFVAQIRLSELVAYDVEKRLPPSGMLYFFYNQGGFVTDRGDVRHGTTHINGQEFVITSYGYNDTAIWRVVYIPDESGALERTAPPSDIPNEQRYESSVPVAVVSELTLPHVETCFIGDPNSKRGALMLTAQEWEAYADELLREVRVFPAHHLLGHSDDSQPMAMEGSFARLRSVLFPELLSLESLSEAEQRQENAANRLLIQVNADENGMHFGRSGPLYFFIRETDLAARNFSRVWAAAQ